MSKIRKRHNSYQIDYFDPNKNRIRKSFKKRKDAEAELGKRVSLIAEGRYLDVKKDYKTTFKELLDQYKENYNNQSSFQSWKKHCIENFKAYFGEETKLANIRYMDLETYRNHLRQKRTKNGTVRTDASVNREMSCLHHTLSKAVEWEMMEQNPFDQGKTLILKENNQRMRYLTKDEIGKLLDECPKYLKRIVECAINTGMRRGEILSLKWSQIKDDFIYLKKTKTNESRQVPINDDLAQLFKRIRKDKQLRSEYVFSNNGGKPLNSVKKGFKATCRRAGIEDFKFHDLRHTFASQMIMRGANLKDVQEILGHKTMAMTLRYAHLSQEHKKKAVNLLNGLTASSAESECHKTVTFPEPRLSANS